MSASMFGPPPRRLTKFKARQRALWRLKFEGSFDHSLSIPFSRFSTPAFVAMTASIAVAMTVLMFIALASLLTA